MSNSPPNHMLPLVELSRVKYSFEIWAVAMLGSLVATGGKGIIRIFEPKNGADSDPTLMDELRGHTWRVLCVAFSPNGTLLASGGYDSLVVIWDMATHSAKHTLRSHTYCILGVAWLPDSDGLVSASTDGTAILWSAKTGQQLRVFRGHSSDVNTVAVSPNGQCIATGSRDKTVRLWQPDSDQQQACLTDHTSYVYSVAFQPTDSSILLSGSWGLILAHDLRTNTVVFRLEQRGYRFCWTPDGRFFLSSSSHSSVDNNIVTLWDFASHSPVAHYKQHTGRVVDLAADGRQFLTASCDNTVHVVAFPWPVFVDPCSLCAADVNRLALLQLVLLQPHDDIITFAALLQMQGVNVNATDAEGDTALHVAMHLQNQEAVRALKAAGADESIANVAGRTACAPVNLYDLLPPELWAMIVIDFCAMPSIQRFAWTCKGAWNLLAASGGGYRHRVLARRGLAVVVQARNLAALRLLLKRMGRDRIQARVEKEDWPEALEWLKKL